MSAISFLYLPPPTPGPNVVPHDIILDFEEGMIVTLNQKNPWFSKSLLIRSFWKHIPACSDSSAHNNYLWILEDVPSFSKIYMRILIFAWCFIWNSNSWTSSSLKVHYQVEDNFWHLEAFWKWWKLHFISLKSLFHSQFFSLFGHFMPSWGLSEYIANRIYCFYLK